MPRSGSSKRWLARQSRDPYVKRARAGGWRSRGAFKLMELDRRWRLLRPGLTVVDLGAAPGGWSQVAAQRVGAPGRVLAVDLTFLEPLAGVTRLQGDLTHRETVAAIERWTDGALDLVLCDMAPNLSGVRVVDQARSLELAERVLDLATRWLTPQGALVIKLFEGEGVAAWRDLARARYERVEVTKPGASRRGSREIYAFCGRKRGSLVGPVNV
ncbi:MAG: RlmE family RNA methyltransferase [Pseudomonadales bacterium]